MDKVIYFFCGFTSALCALMLLLGYRRTRMRLLLWSGIAFVFFTCANSLIYFDFVVWPEPETNLLPLRHALSLAGVSFLLFGMIWETV